VVAAARAAVALVGRGDGLEDLVAQRGRDRRELAVEQGEALAWMPTREAAPRAS
jgi:hypothetical protein